MPPASRRALEKAEIVTGAARHLDLLPEVAAKARPWPVPFADGIDALLQLRGRDVVMLASGDPFWFGAGSVLARHLKRGEWRALPAPSSLSLAAAALGWPLEQTPCFGLHAAPFSRLRPALHPGARLLATVRDGAAVARLAHWLEAQGFGESGLYVLEALGGPRQRIRLIPADGPIPTNIAHPVIVGIEVAGQGAVVPLASGRPDTLFDHDGQITKRPIRAMTLSTLAPCPGEHLWDIGGGSGSIAIEWLLAHPSTTACAFEINPARAARIEENAHSLGVDRLEVLEGDALTRIGDPDLPDAVFIGGGISGALLAELWDMLPEGVRVVANAVTLEGESLLTEWQGMKGGELMRIELATAQPLGRKRGWKASYPVVQWSVVT